MEGYILFEVASLQYQVLFNGSISLKRFNLYDTYTCEHQKGENQCKYTKQHNQFINIVYQSFLYMYQSCIPILPVYVSILYTDPSCICINPV